MTPERKVVVRDPENSETPLEAIHSWVTPTRLFFIRNHFDVPQIAADDWRLTIGGRVQTTREITYADLETLPHRTVLSTVECAGNGRSFLRPPEAGVQWGAGAVAQRPCKLNE